MFRVMPVVVLIAMLAVVLPQLPDAPALRALLALGCLWALVRHLELAWTDWRPSTLERVWFIAAPYDTRNLLRAPAPTSWRRFLARVGLSALAGLACLLAFHGALSTGVEALRWLGAAVGFYLGVQAVLIGLSAVHESLGWFMPPVLVQPLMSRSVAEFWGRRWNRPVRDWLYRRAFLPHARRGHPTRGLLVAFALSAFAHTYPIAVSLTPAMAASMAAFFLLQPGLIGLERVMGIGTWSPTWARAWTVSALLVTSPLFTEPLLQFMTPGL